MNRIWTLLLICIIPITAFAQKQDFEVQSKSQVSKKIEELFGTDPGCFALRDIDSGKWVIKVGAAHCVERLYPCSSFKVPLAVMGFDSEVLKDENTTFKWDGAEQPIKSWEKDHNARSWLKDSVVWYSQRVTPKLGLEKIGRYLKDFDYGNRDFSGGIAEAWLSSTLKISAEEQVNFLTRLHNKKLNVSPAAIDKTLSILPIEMDDSEMKIAGKTGSGFSWKDPKFSKGKGHDHFRVGWYVGYFQRAGKRFAFATVFKGKTVPGEFAYAGPEAKKIATSALRIIVQNRIVK